MICSAVNVFPRCISCSPLVCAPEILSPKVATFKGGKSLTRTPRESQPILGNILLRRAQYPPPERAEMAPPHSHSRVLPMPHDVFISHSSKDKTIADAACACLESRGIRCWVAPRDIMPGADWSASIIDGISGAKAMVLILSSHSNVSKQVLREIERAANRSIPILPFRIEDIELSKSLEYFLSSSHWLDAYDGEFKHYVELLANSVARTLAREDAVRSVPAVSTARKTPSRMPFVWAACVAGVLAVSGLALVAHPRQQKRDEAATPSQVSSVPDTSVPIDVKPKLGISFSALREVVAKKLGAGDGGMWVSKVLPSQKADIQRGDILLQIGDTRLFTADDLTNTVNELKIGASYEAELLRDGKTKRITLQPIAVPSEKLLAYSSAFDDAINFGYGEDVKSDLSEIFRLQAAGGTLLAWSRDEGNAWRQDGTGHRELKLPKGRYGCGSVSQDGSLIILAQQDTGSLTGIKVRNEQVVLSTGPTRADLKRVLISPENVTALAISSGGESFVVDVTRQKIERQCNYAAVSERSGVAWSGLKDASFSLGGKYLLTVHHDNNCLVWDWQNDSLCRAYAADSSVYGAALSHDASRLAILSASGTIDVWDNVGQTKIATLRGHEGGELFNWGDVCFLPPRCLASVCRADGTFRIWDLERGQPEWELPHSGFNCLGFDCRTERLYCGGGNQIGEVLIPECVGLVSPNGLVSDVELAPMPIKLGDDSSKEMAGLAGELVAATTSESDSDSFGLGIRVGFGHEGSGASDANTKVGDGITVDEVVAGGQAARDGVIRRGDVITAVIERAGAKPTALAGLSATEATRLLRGQEGSSVGLLVRRDGSSEPLEIVAKRGRLLPVRSRAAQSVFANSIGMEFIAVPGGIGTLGIERRGDETRAPHYVRISKGFLIGAHEVTQEEFAVVMSTRPSVFSRDGQKADDVVKALGKGAIPNPDTSHHPVDSVSWEDAAEFCRMLSEKEGRAYRLPTEAEWEWACRNAGTTVWEGLYPGGTGINETAVARHLDFPATPHPVGSRSPNDAGIHDMFGNVAEWCSDVFAEDGFSKAAFVDPKGPSKGLKRVVRGGAFQEGDNAYFERTGLGPSEKRPYVGFRIVLEPTVGMLADNDLEQSILDTSRWEIDESLIPDPLPAVQGPLRTADEEKHEAADIRKAILEGSDLREIRAKITASANQNQSQFDQIKHMFAELCARTGDRSVASAYADYRAAKQENLVSLFERARAKDSLLGFACNDLAWALATNADEEQRDPVVAVIRAVEACQIAKWQYWGFLDTLAAALAAAGRHDAAVRVAEAALSRAPESGRRQCEHCVELYKQGKTWAPLQR
jgi:formylglycine-generating enzyme required for sulfatase activity